MSNLEQITATLRTDTGLVRGHNEDFVSYWEPRNLDEEAKNGWLYIVADGGAGNNIRNAPFINHTDQELSLIETLVGRKTPFVFSGPTYTGPRRTY